MLNKFLIIIVSLILISCKKTYFEPNTPITQTDLSGTNWVVTQGSLTSTSFDTIRIHFISSTGYKIDTSSIINQYSVYTSYTNEDLSFYKTPFFGNSDCCSIVPLDFKNSNNFYVNLKDLYSSTSTSLYLKFTKY